MSDRTRGTVYDFVCLLNYYKNIFDREIDGEDDLLSGMCTNSGTEIFKRDDPALKQCENSVKYLTSLKQLDNNMLNVFDGCKYLSYRLYTALMKNNQSSYTTVHFYTTINDKIDDGLNICDGVIEDLSADIFDKLHKVVELYEKFNKIGKEFTSTGDKCNCAKECANLYKDYIPICHNGDDDNFCVALEKFRGQYNYYMLTETCNNDVPKILPSTRNYNLLVYSIWCVHKPYHKKKETYVE
ncbi:PIR Superfamily Protein [Plasmodium ovale wallikeri]|uniref:PIR Superfamily Protein n=1 Tax=Plasmodium ovale wallikeri TaxID=864142 RepID=A0A1A9AK90_PLAOA|nr:PIR Superfamily Protein [Plasmodium ovale wallikeri]SBT56916.1 PIR Superfamily Protein [Plasmodium ovale wallikeri]